MTLLQQPTRVHVTLPAPLLERLRFRFPHLSLATAVREALAEAARPETAILRLPPELRAKVTAEAVAQGVTFETALLSLLRQALSAASDTPAPSFSLEVQLFTLATVRQILELALDNDPQRVEESTRIAREWIRDVHAGSKPT